MNSDHRDRRWLATFLATVLPFIALATLNSAGYRFGASDQAFYAPAIFERMDPALFPRDTPLIRAQAALTLADNAVGPLLRVTGVPAPVLFAALYAAALAALAAAALAIAGSLYRTTAAGIALLAVLTMRHAITRTGTNSLEGYFHPRQLAFACGALAIAALLRGRYAATAGLVLIGAALHPTTGAWFAIWIGVALAVAEPRWRAGMALGAAGVLAGAAWALTLGPLAGRLVVMDPDWLATLAGKSYLFPLDWPLGAWLVNLAYVPLIIWIFRARQAAGLVAPREAALVAGCLSLVVVFAVALPLNAMKIALAVQLQPARIFWMLDLLASIYVVWMLAERSRAAGSAARARIVAAALVGLSIARGSYIMQVEFPGRPVAQVDVKDDDWGRAMAWARRSDPASGWLADPVHAVRYGTSVRVAGRRDVWVEEIKDAAVGMYDRSVAMRTQARAREIADFSALTPAEARRIAARDHLDYLVTEQVIDLPLAFSSGAIRVYRLR